MIPLAPWAVVNDQMPPSGRHLWGCVDGEQVWVFCAHRPDIAAFLLDHGHFGGDRWSGDRITRFRLSMPRVMARSSQGQREGKECIVGLALRRDAMEQVLRQAIHWREFPEAHFSTAAQWRLAVRFTQVVLDWAPDSDVSGEDLTRLTPRFGLRSEALRGLGKDWVLDVQSLDDLAVAWRSGLDEVSTPTMQPLSIPRGCDQTRLLWDPDAVS